MNDEDAFDDTSAFSTVVLLGRSPLQPVAQTATELSFFDRQTGHCHLPSSCFLSLAQKSVTLISSFLLSFPLSSKINPLEFPFFTSDDALHILSSSPTACLSGFLAVKGVSKARISPDLLGGEKTYVGIFLVAFVGLSRGVESIMAGGAK